MAPRSGVETSAARSIGRRTQEQRVAAVMGEHLPARRVSWADRCAWSAAALKEAEPDGALWVDMALVGRALAGDAPLDTIPLMTRVAEDTVGAFMAR